MCGESWCTGRPGTPGEVLRQTSVEHAHSPIPTGRNKWRADADRRASRPAVERGITPCCSVSSSRESAWWLSGTSPCVAGRGSHCRRMPATPSTRQRTWAWCSWLASAAACGIGDHRVRRTPWPGTASPAVHPRHGLSSLCAIEPEVDPVLFDPDREPAIPARLCGLDPHGPVASRPSSQGDRSRRGFGRDTSLRPAGRTLPSPAARPFAVNGPLPETGGVPFPPPIQMAPEIDQPSRSLHGST